MSFCSNKSLDPRYEDRYELKSEYMKSILCIWNKYVSPVELVPLQLLKLKRDMISVS